MFRSTRQATILAKSAVGVFVDRAEVSCLIQTLDFFWENGLGKERKLFIEICDYIQVLAKIQEF